MFQWDARALEILNTLERAGHQAVLVGGCVRDALLGREPHDYDAAVSAPPEEILAACRSKFKCIPTGLAHGTVTVVHNGLPVEVTAFRKEGTYSTTGIPTGWSTPPVWRRTWPGVTSPSTPWPGTGAASLTPSADRRTWPPGSSAAWGSRTAASRRTPCGCSGDLRLARPAGLPGLEGETAAAIRRDTPLLSYVAWERIQAEFLRLLCCPGAERILLDFPETVCQIVPELTPAVGLTRKTPTTAMMCTPTA